VRVLAFFVALLVAGSAFAQRGLAISPPDPFIITELSPTVVGNSTPVSLTPRATINTAETNVVVILAGQSLAANTSGTYSAPTNASAINNVNIYDGASYPPAANLLGCTNSAIGTGNVGTYLADQIINAGKAQRVWLVPIAVGGTSVADWATGNLSGRIGVTMRRLASRGITPSTTNTSFIFVWMQGEQDASLGTSSAAYQASFATIVSALTGAGFSGRIFVNLETYSGSTNATIRAAQAAVVNGTTIFQGGDIDTLTGGTNRQGDSTHLTAAGASAAAGLIWTAIHATGAPY